MPEQADKLEACPHCGSTEVRVWDRVNVYWDGELKDGKVVVSGPFEVGDAFENRDEVECRNCVNQIANPVETKGITASTLPTIEIEFT